MSSTPPNPSSDESPDLGQVGFVQSKPVSRHIERIDSNAQLIAAAEAGAENDKRDSQRMGWIVIGSFVAGVFVLMLIFIICGLIAAFIDPYPWSDAEWEAAAVPPLAPTDGLLTGEHRARLFSMGWTYSEEATLKYPSNSGIPKSEISSWEFKNAFFLDEGVRLLDEYELHLPFIIPLDYRGTDDQLRVIDHYHFAIRRIREGDKSPEHFWLVFHANDLDKRVIP